MADHALTGSSLALARMILTVGHSAEVSRYTDADKVIYPIKGRVTVHAGSETFLLEAADALAISGGLPHRIANAGTDDAEMIVSYSAGNNECRPNSTVEQVWAWFINWQLARARRREDDGTLGPVP
jgi:mannose-6-phosphate isomerase-like protein (cupin superfamily)